MPELNRRTVLTLGAALGLTGAAAAAPGVASAAPRAWSWSPAGSVIGSGSGVDPQWVWDDEIDQIMANVITSGQTAQVNTAMRNWVNNWQPVPSGLPAPLKGWFAEHVKMPDWADMSKLRRAAAFNRRAEMFLFFIYGIGGGIMSTVIPREARSVYWSKGGADMQDRAAKTFSFGYDLSNLNAFEWSGEFKVTSNKTRIVHAAVRHLLPQSPHWQASGHDETIPISNADILVTFHSTGTFAHKKMKEWGVRMSAAEEEAFLHSWQVALHYLGVRDEYIPATWDQAHAQAAQTLDPIMQWTPEGQDLAEVLLGLTAQIDLGVTRGFLNEFVRYQLGDQIGDWLGLFRDPVSRTLIEEGWPIYVKFRDGLIPVLPVTFWVFDKFIRGLAMAFLNRWQSPSTTPIEVPDMNRPM
ncbi:oxygenase MpaB family protein [Agromyces sp. LHK192]|uniref:oxygenase MpaB family protein n=1 Tax=Agromyces sp. LHK192 TaxID=2498704 RepID=UPI000FDCB8EF|nr:oxygenase MpaB family protein [Agromyces sp. LHK192]